mgnify:FL=1
MVFYSPITTPLSFAAGSLGRSLVSDAAIEVTEDIVTVSVAINEVCPIMFANLPRSAPLGVTFISNMASAFPEAGIEPAATQRTFPRTLSHIIFPDVVEIEPPQMAPGGSGAVIVV